MEAARAQMIAADLAREAQRDVPSLRDVEWPEMRARAERALALAPEHGFIVRDDQLRFARLVLRFGEQALDRDAIVALLGDDTTAGHVRLDRIESLLREEP